MKTLAALAILSLCSGCGAMTMQESHSMAVTDCMQKYERYLEPERTRLTNQCVPGQEAVIYADSNRPTVTCRTYANSGLFGTFSTTTCR